MTKHAHSTETLEPDESARQVHAAHLGCDIAAWKAAGLPVISLN